MLYLPAPIELKNQNWFVQWASCLAMYRVLGVISKFYSVYRQSSITPSSPRIVPEFIGLMAIARAAFLEGVGVAEGETEVDVAELLVLLFITLEIVDAEPVWLVVPHLPPSQAWK
jgi:hypothetical protein